MTGHAAPLGVIHHQGEAYICVSDLAGAISSMVDSLQPDSEQRAPLVMIRTALERIIAGPPEIRDMDARACPSCGKPVVKVPAVGQDQPVTVEVHTSPTGQWVPVDAPGGGPMLVPWQPSLDGIGVRVDTHTCTTATGATGGP